MSEKIIKTYRNDVKMTYDTRLYRVYKQNKLVAYSSVYEDADDYAFHYYNEGYSNVQI